MRLTGIIDYTMGNFLCIRGFAPMIDLANLSESIQDIQRNLIEEHTDEMQQFLSSGDFTFFPEVILCANLKETDETAPKINNLYEAVRKKSNITHLKIGEFSISAQGYTRKSKVESRKNDYIQSTYLDFDENETSKMLRIDGNHRLSAVNEGSTQKIKDMNVPFCLLIFRNNQDTDKFCRALFHNINSKQIPLKAEENLKIIIESKEVFTDEVLKNDTSFGWNYYLTRELCNGLDLALFPSVNTFISNAKYTFFVDLFKFLEDSNLINYDVEAIAKIRGELHEINSAIQESAIQTTTGSIAVIGALSYYKLTNQDKYQSFIKWIKKNDIGSIKDLRLDDVIKIYDNIYIGIPKKVFLARWYPQDTDTECSKANHRFNAIKEVVEELGLELVDMGTRNTGTFDIRSVMYDELSKSDIFIADLSGTRHNVMVEVGYALRHIEMGRMIFYFQQNIALSDSVPFDLNGFAYDLIEDSAEIKTKTKGRLQTILEKIKSGEL